MSAFTDQEIAAVKGIYARPNGKWEAVVTHKSIPKPGRSKLFGDEREARIWKLQTLLELNSVQSNVPAEHAELHLKRPMAVPAMLRTYFQNAILKPSTKAAVETLIRREDLQIQVSQITYRWTEDWIAGMKTGERRVKPDTIKVHVQTLRNALDWYFREYWLKAGINDLPTNPLRQLPDNYSAYQEDDPNRLVNAKRNRRLWSDEEHKIEGVLRGEIKRKCNRPFKARRMRNGNIETPADLLMLFRLLINTGLRLREAYRLRMCDIDLKTEILHVAKSKLTNEDTKVSGERTLPLMPQLAAWLREYVVARGLQQGSQEPLFPWWTGETEKVDLDRISSALSQRFAAIFRDANCPGLREHDLRHEGTTRFCELRYPDGRRMYSKDEVMTFTGHTEDSTFERYKRLFVEDITPKALLARQAAGASWVDPALASSA